jgi:hypothetical protein
MSSSAGGGSVPAIGGGAPGSAGPGGNTCNSLSAYGAPPVEQVFASEVGPVPVGGTIPDGVYVLTHDVVYVGVTGVARNSGLFSREIQVFAGATVSLVTQPPAPAPAIATSGTYSIGGVVGDAGVAYGATVSFVLTCPQVEPIVVRGYSITGDTLLEFVTPNEVLTYTRV